MFFSIYGRGWKLSNLLVHCHSRRLKTFLVDTTWALCPVHNYPLLLFSCTEAVTLQHPFTPVLWSQMTIILDVQKYTLFFCSQKNFCFPATFISNAKYFIWSLPEKLKLSHLSDHSDIKNVSSETFLLALYLTLLGHSQMPLKKVAR